MAKKKKAVKKKKVGKQEKEGQKVVIVMIGIIAVMVIGALILNSSNNFRYMGLDFEKTKYGELIIYNAEVPIVNAFGQITGYIALNLRNDPRQLKDIPVETNGDIKFLNDVVYLSVDPATEECEDSGVAIVTLGLSLKDAGLSTKLSSLDEEHAGEQAIPYITCESHPTNTVLKIVESNETKVIQTGMNCYELRFKECDITKATEKFSLVIVGQHMENLS